MSTTEHDDPGESYHALFLPDHEDDECPKATEIKAIYVRRFDARGPVAALRPYSPDELREPSDVHAAFGGGPYELIARGFTGAILKKRKLQIPGPPKSMDGTPEVTADPYAQRAPVAAAPVPDGSGGMNQLVMVLLQQAQAQQALMVQMMQQSTQVLVAALANRGDGGSSAAMMQALASIAGKSIEAAATAAAGRNDPMDAFTKGVSLGKEIGGNDDGGDSGSDLADMANTAGAVMQGLSALGGNGVPAKVG